MPRRLQRRQQREQQRRRGRRGERENEDAAIEVSGATRTSAASDGGSVLKKSAVAARSAHAAERERDAAGDHRDEQPFGQQLAHDAARGSRRATAGPRSRGGARSRATA